MSCRRSSCRRGVCCSRSTTSIEFPSSHPISGVVLKNQPTKTSPLLWAVSRYPLIKRSASRRAEVGTPRRGSRRLAVCRCARSKLFGGFRRPWAPRRSMGERRAGETTETPPKTYFSTLAWALLNMIRAVELIEEVWRALIPYVSLRGVLRYYEGLAQGSTQHRQGSRLT